MNPADVLKHAPDSGVIFRAMLIILTTLLFLFLPAAFAEQDSIQQYLDSNQPSGWGQGIVIDKNVGNLYGNADSLVVLYTYQIGTERDRNHWQYLVVLEELKQKTPRILVGGGRLQQFNKLEIRDKRIILTGNRHSTNDPMASPSLKVSQSYEYRNSELVAVGNQI